VMGVGARLSRVAHAAVSPGTRTSSQAAHGTSGPVRRLCNINRPNGAGLRIHHSGVLRVPRLALTRARRCPVAWGEKGVYNAYPWLLAGVPHGLPQPFGVVSPLGQAGGEALERSLVRSVMDAGVAVKGFRPEDMSLREIRSL
jgi:hypothetical protein